MTRYGQNYTASGGNNAWRSPEKISLRKKVKMEIQRGTAKLERRTEQVRRKEIRRKILRWMALSCLCGAKTCPEAQKMPLAQPGG